METNNAQCIKIIVDNLTLADIINGDAVLKNAKIIPAISRIMDRLETWMTNGWKTGDTENTTNQQTKCATQS